MTPTTPATPVESGLAIPDRWPAAGDLETRGAALQKFLRSCRARLSSGAVGAWSMRRRSGTGLRQEDVAVLAGVSPRWYEVFETGKSRRRFSPGFVTRVAHALRLNREERAILYRLALPEVAETVDFFERVANERDPGVADTACAC
jgi:helix-turn-helix protein